jgi:hypothetical protein
MSLRTQTKVFFYKIETVTATLTSISNRDIAMRRQVQHTLLFIAVILAVFNIDRAAFCECGEIEPREAPVDGTLSASWKAYQYPLVPIEVNDTSVLAILSTGTAITFVDKSLEHLLGDVAARSKAETAGGEIQVNIYRAANVRLAKQKRPIPGDTAVTDFSALRKLSGLPIHSVIGRSFLESKLIVFDPLKERVTILDRPITSTAPDGTKIQMRRGDTGEPLVSATLPDDTQLDIILALGKGRYSVSLEPTIFQRLVDSGYITALRNITMVTSAGQSQVRSGQLSKIQVGPFAVTELSVTGPCGPRSVVA